MAGAGGGDGLGTRRLSSLLNVPGKESYYCNVYSVIPPYTSHRKYTDATLLGQSDSSGGEEGALESSHASHVVRQPVTMVSQDSEEEEEVDTGGGEVRR